MRGFTGSGRAAASVAGDLARRLRDLQDMRTTTAEAGAGIRDPVVSHLAVRLEELTAELIGICAAAEGAVDGAHAAAELLRFDFKTAPLSKAALEKLKEPAKK